MSQMQPFFSADNERQRRWRLILGKMEEQTEEADGQGDGEGEPADADGLSPQDQAMDQALQSLYGDGDEGSLDDSAPDIARWLGDIRSYFPGSVAHLLQQEAFKKLNLRKLLRDPDFINHIEPDMALATKLLSLRRVMPNETRATAKKVVRAVVEEIKQQLEFPLVQAIQGSLQRATRTYRPKFKEINWQRTVYANLKHYQPTQKTVVPERLIGYGRQRSSLKDVILCIDQSGSMAQSVVYASIFASVMASLPSLSTKVVVFASDLADISDQIDDPVEALFGIQLKGGTNIARALGYCQQLVGRPRDTILILITDLYEGGNKDELMLRLKQFVGDGIRPIVLLSLNDQGAPRFNRQIAEQVAALGIPAFACTPNKFPDLMGAAINGRNIAQWAASAGIVTAPYS